MLLLYRFMSVFALLFVGVLLQAQTCQPAPNGGDECSTAPLMSCNLDGYMGTSAGYTPGPPPDGFCGLVENDQYFRFVVDEVPVVIQIAPSSCSIGKGLQATLYETTDCTNFTEASLCASFGFVQSLSVVAAGVSVGQELYLMIDGFEGDVCDFTINVVQGILPDVEAIADDAEICLGNQIQLDATASTQRSDVEYYWTTTNGNIVSGENSLMPTVDALGDYTLTVIDVVSCCIDEITIEVTENMSSPTFNFDPTYTVNCTDPTLNIDPNLADPGNYTYSWSTLDGTIDPGSSLTGMSIQANAGGTYTLEIEDQTTFCSYVADVVVTEDNQDPDVTATSSNNLDCNNTSTTIEAQSSIAVLAYSWDGPNGFTSNMGTFSGSDAGTYSVTVTAANGCTNESAIAVTSSGNPDASIAKERDINCNNIDTRLTGSSTTANVTFAWTGPNGGALGNTSEITVTDPGTYTLVVSLPNGCSTTVTEVVMQDITSPDVSASVSNELDCTTLSTTLVGTSTTIGALYNWTGPGGFTSTMTQPIASVPGSYTLTVTGPNGCTDAITVEVIQNATPPNADAGAMQTVDCNNANAILGGANTSMGAVYSYQWTVDGNPAILGTDPTLTVTTGGIYTLTVVNTINNCSSTSTVQIDEQKTLPTADAGGDAFLTCGMRSVVLGGASSTGPEFTYEWTDDAGVVVSDEETYMTTLIGTYNLEVTNTATGCVSDDQAIVDEDPYSPVAVITNPEDITCMNPTITLESAGSSSGAGIQYAWFDNNNILVSIDPDAQISVSGSYKLVVTDSNVGCADSTVIRVDENITPPLGSAGVDMSLDCSTNQVTLQASVSGDLIDFSFQWFDNTGTPVGADVEFTTSIPGVYDLIITDIENGCTRASSAVVNDNNVYPDADAGAPATVTCTDSQVMIGGMNSSTGADIIHEWFDSSGDLVGNTPTIMVSQADTYELVVTNASSSCSATELVVVAMDQVEPLAVIASPDMITCSDPAASLDGSSSTASNGTVSYVWTDPTGAVISNVVDASASAMGTYTLTVTDIQNGCQNITTVEVDEDVALPTIEVTNPEIINCYNNFVEVNYNSPDGPITPVWQDVNGNILSTEETFLATSVGTVVLEATSQSNGCVNTASIDIVEDLVPPVAAIADPVTLTCVVEEAVLVSSISNFTSAATYNWTNNLGDNLGQEADLTVNTSGIYTLEITNVDNGCTATFFSMVPEDVEDPVAVINNTENRIDCFVPSIDIDASMSTGNAPLTYEWTNDSGDSISDLEAFQLTEGGEITLLVTNSVNGCTSTAAVDIVYDQEAPVIGFNPVDDLTCTENTVVVASVVTGSNNSFAYTWQGPGSAGIVSGANDPSATVDLVGQYTVTVIDQINGCESVAQISVEEDRILPDVAFEPVQELNCVTNQVSIDASGSSVGSQFTYAWTGPGITSDDDTPIIEVDAEGDYSLLVINTATGCENTIDVAVSENTERPVGATLFMQDPSCFGERDGILDVSDIQGGTAPFLYSVNSQTNFTDVATYTNLPSGDYTLIVQDDIGCEWDTLFQIVDPEKVTADLGADQVIRLGETSDLFVETSGNVTSIAWSDNGVDGPIDVEFREVEPLTTTTYVVIVTNDEGCSGTDNVVVEVEDDNRVYFPTAFSPNGDGVNDFFTVFTDIATQEVSSLQIFDKWGNQVFERNNFMPNLPQEGWDGNWRGDKMPTGTYVYSAFIEFKNGNKINFKGEINIVY